MPPRTKSLQPSPFICPTQRQPSNSSRDALLSKLIVILIVYIGMSKFDSTSIYYHVPEDKDNPDEPNLFTVPVQKNSIRLQHIYQYFPLKGTYIFRFKFSHDGFVVWLDLADSEMKLPTFKDKVHVKASRVSWDEPKYQYPKSQQNTNKVEVKQVQKEVNLFDHPSSPQKVNVQPKVEINLQPNLLGFSSPSTTSGNLNLLGDFSGANKYQKSDFTHNPGNDKHDLI